MSLRPLKDCIKSRPNFSLKDCLTHYDKDELMELAEKQHMILNMGAPIKAEQLVKKETVKSLVTQIVMNFPQDLFYIPPRELEFLIKVMAVDFEAVDYIDKQDCYFIHSLGYLYLYDFNEKIYPVVPKEIRKIYEGFPQSELKDDAKESAELYMYATALTQLYGIYTVDQFLEVWNSHHEEQLSFDDASFYFYMTYDRQNYYEYDYEYVIAKHFQGNEGYELFEKMKDKPYYIPTKDEVKRYSQEIPDNISPDYKDFGMILTSNGRIDQEKKLI